MLEGTTAFVTGASQGIGREIAETLAEQGAHVALAARSNNIYEISDNLGDNGLAIETDVTDPESVENSIAETVEQFGGLDCLVNNAGIAGPTAPIEEIDEAEWNKTFDVNVSGCYRTVKYAGPHLRESNQGRIINISSISGKRPLMDRTPYTASKMAIIGLTRTLAVEFGDDDVTVNAICPGPTEGPRLDAVIEEQAKRSDKTISEVKQDLFLEDAALGSMVSAEDISEMIVFLVSNAARNVTAQDINVDAGTIWY